MRNGTYFASYIHVYIWTNWRFPLCWYPPSHCDWSSWNTSNVPIWALTEHWFFYAIKHWKWSKDSYLPEQQSMNCTNDFGQWWIDSRSRHVHTDCFPFFQAYTMATCTQTFWHNCLLFFSYNVTNNVDYLRKTSKMLVHFCPDVLTHHLD